MKKSLYMQESWISKLPSVLFICLNRYKFIKATQSSSKILEPFEFYEHIYLDRFMELNRELVKTKRAEMHTLKLQLNELELKLQAIQKYTFTSDNAVSSNNNSLSFPLDQVLKCTLDFLNADFSSTSSPSLSTSTFSDIKAACSASEQELAAMQRTLNEWIVRTELKIAELTERIAELKRSIETIYDQPELRKFKYSLHSVCIHEGKASSGHFWTYIRSCGRSDGTWFKFNDVDVTETTWENLYANAAGAHNNNSSDDSSHQQQVSSAYFLVYKRDEGEENAVSSTSPTTSVEAKDSELIGAADDLQKLLAEDQEVLEGQVSRVKLRLLLRDSAERVKKSSLQLANLNDSAAAVTYNFDQSNQTCMEHAKAFSDTTLHALASSYDQLRVATSWSGVGVNNESVSDFELAERAFQHAVNTELSKYTESGKEVTGRLPEHDLRINHILIYFNCNGVSDELKRVALYDLFRMQVFADNSNVKLRILQNLAQVKFNEFLIDSIKTATAAAALSSPSSTTSAEAVSPLKSYEKAHADYRDYRSIIAAFISAASFMESQRYEEALPFFCVACEYNERITGNLSARMKGMDHEFLLVNRRKCLKLWSQTAIKKIMRRSSKSHSLASGSHMLSSGSGISTEEMVSLIDGMIGKFLPCFFRLASSTSTDRTMIDEVRQDWLGILDSSVPELPEVFHTFMTKLFEDPVSNHYHSLNVNKTNLSNRYRDTYRILDRIRI
jgi:hypothetical protein